jgi:pimeloyl-ACP methyl ester carboxylesterase
VVLAEELLHKREFQKMRRIAASCYPGREAFFRQELIRIIRPIVAALILSGCAQIATVRQITPHFPAAGIQGGGLNAADRQLEEAGKLEHSDPLRALGGYLASAHSAYDELDRHPTDTAARDLYNFAVARCIEVIESAPLDPWNKSLPVPSPDGEYLLTAIRHRGADRNPADYTIIPADSIVVGGTYFEKRITVQGIGAPVVAIGREEKMDFRKSYASRRLYAAATAIIRFDNHRAQIEFIEPFATDNVTLDGHTLPLAADFTAPLAVGLVSERPDKLGLIRLLRPDKYADTARLTRLQPYDPGRTPVIFVHGLQDTPASWAPMINTLRADPEIRRRYQFWVYSYPSGYPYPYSAALFRQELDGIAQAFPHHKRIVLIAHSMGGMISRLMITDAGDKIWLDYFGKPPAQTPIHGRERQILEESLVFNHRTDVQRIIFLSTPHRGSDLASNWIGRLGASLVRMPLMIATIPVTAISAAATGQTVAPIKRLPNSIDTLSPKNRFVLEVNKLPLIPGVPYHSIIGDRGRGDTPQSSDGVVAYWSSHLDGAQSELIVPSNHSSPRNPQAIAEVRRILELRD